MRQWFPLKNPGFLSAMLLSWKRKKWNQLGEDDPQRLRQLSQWIGDEADVLVGVTDVPKGKIPVVSEVWPTGSVPADIARLKGGIHEDDM